MSKGPWLVSWIIASISSVSMPSAITKAPASEAKTMIARNTPSARPLLIGAEEHRAVDLHEVHLQAAHHLESGVTGADVVEGDLEAAP